MIATIKRAIAPAALALAATCGTALAQGSPVGIWYDQTGRGAVEVSECNGNLCGRLVWLKEAEHKEGCGLQIFGDVKPVAGGKWDGGWIIDPEKDLKTRYDVEITPQGDKLKVMGYSGTKFLSQTMIWTRAPANLPKCNASANAAPSDPKPGPARSSEPPTVYPPPPSTPAPSASRDQPKTAERDAPAAAKPGKDCKIEFGGVTLSFPCPE
jgi:uncharacterized protein (DUF2147 family)